MLMLVFLSIDDPRQSPGALQSVQHATPLGLVWIRKNSTENSQGP